MSQWDISEDPCGTFVALQTPLQRCRSLHREPDGSDRRRFGAERAAIRSCTSVTLLSRCIMVEQRWWQPLPVPTSDPAAPPSAAAGLQLPPVKPPKAHLSVSKSIHPVSHSLEPADVLSVENLQSQFWYFKSPPLQWPGLILGAIAGISSELSRAEFKPSPSQTTLPSWRLVDKGEISDWRRETGKRTNTRYEQLGHLHVRRLLPDGAGSSAQP